MPTLLDITDAEWAALHKRLLVYALRCLGVTTETDRAVPLGRQAQDLVQGVIEAVFEKRRAWHDDRDPYAQLAGMVRSDLSNLRTKKETVHLASPPPARKDTSEERAFDPPSDEDVLEDLIHAECLDILRGFIDEIAARSETLGHYRLGLEDGLKPAEIADFFSIPIDDVYQAPKTFVRRLTPLVINHPCWRRAEPSHE